MQLIEKFQHLQESLSKQVIGQQHLIHQMTVGLLANGHLLVEGAPGLAKTRAIHSLASAINNADFKRIQFTPDLLPADLTGSDIYSQQSNSFSFVQGPIFNNLVLADEVNRAHAKVQSAMLQAMAERTVSVGNNSYDLPKLFMVMATQNPLEQEGTYPLPEAQLDRFMLHILVDYPDKQASKEILQTVRNEAKNMLNHAQEQSFYSLSQEDVFAARQAVLNIHVADVVEDYMLEIIETTRTPARYDKQLQSYIATGASPRGVIAIDACARALAWLDGRDYVTPEDVFKITPDCIRHRLILDYSAEAEGIDSQYVVDKILQVVPSP